MRVHDTVQTAKGQYDFGRVVIQSPAMREVLEMTRRASESEPTTSLSHGESGTGKEVLAKSIHYNSQRAQMPVIRLRRSVRYFTRLCDVLNASGRETHAARISWHPSYFAHAAPEDAAGSR